MKIACVIFTSLLCASGAIASDSHDADQGIEGMLRAALNDKHVHVHVHHGIVTLDGKVRSIDERQRVEDIVRGTSGVVALKDELKVTSPSPGTLPEFPSTVAAVPSAVVPSATVPSAVVVPATPPVSSGVVVAKRIPIYTTPAPEVIPETPVVNAPAPVVIPDYPTLKVQAWTIDDEPVANRIATQLRTDAVPTEGLGNVSIMVRNGNVSLQGVVATQSAHDALVASLQRAGGARAIYDTLRLR